MSKGKSMFNFSPESGKWSPEAPPEHGVHAWVLRTARIAQINNLDAKGAYDAIREMEPQLRAGRKFQPNEIENAINLVFSSEPVPRAASGTIAEASHNWPQIDHGLRAEVIKHGNKDRISRLAGHAYRSHAAPSVILRHLFPEDPLICVSPEFDRGYCTERLSELKAEFLDACQFVVPNAMSAHGGRTQSGKKSVRSLSNTGPRRYQVIEIDDDSLGFEEQAAILLYLARQLPLVMIVLSGNRSAHGWFHVAGADDSIGSPLHDFMRLAVSLGADRAMWTPCQFARMPNGIRRPSGNQQMTLFFDPTLRGWQS
jgi:hypothetical protein